MAVNPFLQGMSRSDDYDDGGPISAGNNPFLQALDAQRKRREEEEERRKLEEQAQSLIAQDEEKQREEEEANKGFFEKAGDVAGAVGGFIKDAAIDVKDTAVGAYEGVSDVIKGQAAANDIEQITEERNALNQQHSTEIDEIFGTAESYEQLSAEQQKQFDETAERHNKEREAFEDRTRETRDKAGEAMQKSQEVDAAKTAFQSAETAMTVMTFGGAGVAKSLAKQGAKRALTQVIKTGTPDTIEALVKSRATALAEATAKEAGKGLVRRTAGRAAPYALEGTAYGVTMTGKNADEDTTLDDYMLNMAFGGLLGGALPIAGAGVKKVAGKATEAVKGTRAGQAVTETADKARSVAAGKVGDSKMLSDALDKQVLAQAGKYDMTRWDKAKVYMAKSINKYADLDRIDDAYRKKFGEVPASERLAHLADYVGGADDRARQMLAAKTSTGMSVDDIQRMYPPGSEPQKELASYLINKRDQAGRLASKGKKKVRGDVDDEMLDNAILDYEQKNPRATEISQTMKETMDAASDYLAVRGAKSRHEIEMIKASNENYFPIRRTTPDDLARPEISGRNVGSIGRVRTIQKFEGSDIPPENTFDAAYDYVRNAVKEADTAYLARKVMERAQQGLIPGAEMVVTAGNKAARNEARQNIAVINKGIKRMQGKLKLQNRDARKLASAINSLNKEGLDVALRDGGYDLAKDFATSGLSKLASQPGKSTNMRAFVKELVGTDPVALRAIRKKIGNREPKLIKALDEVDAMKAEIETYKSAKLAMKDVVANFGDDTTTGKQTISGFVNGEQFKLEVPPNLAKALQGLDETKMHAVVQGFAAVSQVFRATWTGLLNPIFTTKALLFYDQPMAVINSPTGLRQLGPKITAESVKSVLKDDAFQQTLVQHGARRIGGSKLGLSFRPSPEAAAASRDLKSRLKFAATNPKEALDRLDVYGAAAANSTRTRVAKAHYEKAMREGMSPEDAAFEAAYAYNNIMPNYHRTSSLVRHIDAFLPYAGASVSGARSFFRAAKERPVSTLAKSTAFVVAPAVGVAAYSMGSESGQAFYRDMEASGQQHVLKNNMIVVLPGASKDDATGQWDGIIKIPIAPEFRPINDIAWRTVMEAGGGDPVQGQMIAWNLFDFFSADTRGLSNPLLDTHSIIQGNSPFGGRLVNESMEELPADQQVFDSTSNAAINLSDLIGGRLTPVQVDAILGQFGPLGRGVKSEKPMETTISGLGREVYGARGQSAANSFYETYRPLKAQRDAASREVTALVRQGKRGEAARRAEEFNATLSGTFSDFSEQFQGSDAYNEDWDEMMQGLFIGTSKQGFDARAR